MAKRESCRNSQNGDTAHLMSHSSTWPNRNKPSCGSISPFCADCRQALEEFESVADMAVPMLAPELVEAPFLLRSADPAENASRGAKRFNLYCCRTRDWCSLYIRQQQQESPHFAPKLPTPYEGELELGMDTSPGFHPSHRGAWNLCLSCRHRPWP